MDFQGTLNNQIDRKRDNKAETLMLPDFKAYYEATVIRTVQYWHKNRHIDQCDRIEIPEINTHIYQKMSFDKDAKTIQWREDSLFNK